MAYGTKRGFKSTGEYSMGDIAGLALAGAVGIIAAVVTDYQQQGETSALYTINQWVVAAAKMLGFGDVPLWVVIAGLVGIGAGSIFYFQPITRQGAFAQGFGLLAVLMTAVPSDLAGSLETVVGGDLPGLQPASYREAKLGDGVQHASFAAGEARVVLAQAEDDPAASYEVTITVNFPNGLPDEYETMIRKGTLRGRLHNQQMDATYNIFRAGGGIIEQRGKSLIIRAGVPARSEAATLWVRIECDGYTIEEQSSEARLGSPLNWTIDMQASNVPLFIQRLRKSYWF